VSERVRVRVRVRLRVRVRVRAMNITTLGAKHTENESE